MYTKRPFWAVAAGLGMAVGSILTIRHFFEANFPATIYEGSFCDISAFFNCDSSASSSIAAVWDVPLGFPGLVLAFLVLMAAVFASKGLLRTVRFLTALNLMGVVALLVYSVFVLGSLCLLCSIYYVFSAVAFWALWPGPLGPARFTPSFSHLAMSGLALALVGYGATQYHEARRQARSGGDAARVEAQFRALPKVPPPSVLSPNWVVRSSERFEDAPLRIVAWEDFLCSDCLIFSEQLERLKPEFEGQMNVVFQHFPLEAACNDVVEKDKHPGACDLSAMALFAPEHFETIYREVFGDQLGAEEPEWRADLATRLGIASAVADSAALASLSALIRTGAEYEQTSEEYAHGIRSTPTLLINGRLVIGTFPDELLRVMLRSALSEERPDSTRFIESWLD